MAKSKKPSADATVTRIKAVDSETPKKATETKAKATPATTDKKVKKPRKVRKNILFVPFIAFGRYVKGAWVELRQVRWPTRRATWGMTAAVLAFSAFFVIVVLLLDAGFKYLFELILKK